MTAKIEEIMIQVNFFLTQSVTDVSKRPEYFTGLNFFKRKSKLTFERLCFFLIQQPKSSLSIDLEHFFSQLKVEGCTKSAFCKARYKIKSAFFKAWSIYIVTVIYRMFDDNIKRWNGLRVKAIDGTTLHLFEAPGIVDEFGGAQNQFCKIPMARAVFEVDVLNGFCTQANIGSYHTDETDLAESFLSHSNSTDLIIYDRYFPSFELIYKHIIKDIPFLMRCRASFNTPVKDFVKSGKLEAVVSFKITPQVLSKLISENYVVTNTQTVSVRLLRIDIGQDEPEILITTLFETAKYKHAAFKELYFLRWGIETFIDKMKNKLQIELFSGHKPEAVYQDFYSNVIAANMYELFAFACTPDLEKTNAVNRQKEQPEQKINRNVSIGIFKYYAVNLYLGQKKLKIIKILMKKFKSQLVQILPGRQKPRIKKQQNKLGKYKTLTNYRKCL